MRRWMRCLWEFGHVAGALLLGILLASWPAVAEARLPGCEPMADVELQDHPLACKAFATDGRALSWKAFIDKLGAARAILLGEVHDNGVIHRMRAQTILALGARWGSGPRPALLLEHIASDQQLALTAFRALDRQRRRDPAEIFAALDWEKSGWPRSSLFQPLFAAALDLEWPILPANAPKQEVRNVARGTIAALPSEEARRLALDVALADTQQAALLDELEGSHCGLMPRSALGGMADAQRYRDAHMARALADAASLHGHAVLLAGNGHVHRDRGVPWHLARFAPDIPAVSVLYLEVVEAKRAPSDYVNRTSGGADAAADVIVFTPRALRTDPCIAMRKRFGR